MYYEEYTYKNTDNLDGAPRIKGMILINCEVVNTDTSTGKASYSPLHVVELREAIAQGNNAKALEEIKKHTDGYCSLSGKTSYTWGDNINPVNIDKQIEKARATRKEAREWWQSLTPEEQKTYIKEKKNFKQNQYNRYKR